MSLAVVLLLAGFVAGCDDDRERKSIQTADPEQTRVLRELAPISGEAAALLANSLIKRDTACPIADNEALDQAVGQLADQLAVAKRSDDKAGELASDTVRKVWSDRKSECEFWREVKLRSEPAFATILREKRVPPRFYLFYYFERSDIEEHFTRVGVGPFVSLEQCKEMQDEAVRFSEGISRCHEWRSSKVRVKPESG
jgi:hypothetical protein